MAQFSIYLNSPRGQFNLTNYDSVNGLLLGNTFNEQINLSVDDSSFVFSMLKYRYQASRKTVNELALRIEYGSIIRVEIEGKNYVFSVVNIDYTFLADNLQLTFTCQDAFQNYASKLGIGYTIEDDTNSINYIGAQSIDDWAYKIVRENNLDWTYVAIDSANKNMIMRIASAAAVAARDNIVAPEDWEAIDAAYIDSLRPNPATLNVTVSFSCSDSNAYEALKNLASQNELVIQTDYMTRRFWFAPRKSLIFNGYYVRPDNNLQELTLQGRGENLATVLNVVGGTDIDGNEITLIPNLPPKVQAFIESPEWLSSVYNPQLYASLYADESATVTAADSVFLRQIAAVPWLENKLINIDYFADRYLLSYEVSDVMNRLNNQLRIVNGRLMNASRHFFTEQEKWMQTITKLESEGELVTAHMVADIQYVYDQMFDIARLKQIKDSGTSNIQWPFWMHLYEDKNGDQYYCCPLNTQRSDIRVYGTLTNGGAISPLPETPLPQLNSKTSFSVDVVADAAALWLDDPSSFRRWSNRISLPQGINTHVLTSFIEALRFKQKIEALPTDPVIDLDTFLQEKISAQESLYQLLLENTYKFKQELETSLPFYVKMRKVGVITSSDTGKIVTDTAYIEVNDRINMVDADTFTQDQINYLYGYFTHLTATTAPNAHATRSEIISLCASIEGSLTQYWKVMRSCGLKLGLFFPETWNCIDLLELCRDNTVSTAVTKWCSSYMELIPLRYIASSDTYVLNSNYTPPSLTTKKDTPYKLRFYDQQKQILYPLRTLTSSINRSHSNTDLNYQLVTDTYDDALRISPYFGLYYAQRPNVLKESQILELYRTKLKTPQIIYISNTYSTTTDSVICYTPCIELLSRLCNIGTPGEGFTGWDVSTRPLVAAFTPSMAVPLFLVKREIASTNYYQYQLKHNIIWQKLYADYPGIFRESTYTDEASSNTTELYNAAVAQLDQLSHPEFAYTISALDIYMYNQDLLPINIQLGDQIRIDYQDEPTRFDSVNRALREALFVTGIRHTLRSDGDYQFTVETRRATDIMVQRFAQLLSGGR